MLFITLFGIIYDHVWQVSFTHLATTIQCDDCSRQIINKLLHTRRFDTGAARMILKQVPQVRPIYQQSIVHAFNLVMLFSAFFMFVIGVLTLMLAAHGNRGSTNKKAADDSGL